MSGLLDQLKLVVAILAIVALLYGAFRLFGLKGLLAAIGSLGLLLIYRKGRNDGSTHQIEKERTDADSAVRESVQARHDAARRDADPERLRDDDGFKRSA